MTKVLTVLYTALFTILCLPVLGQECKTRLVPAKYRGCAPEVIRLQLEDVPAGTAIKWFLPTDTLFGFAKVSAAFPEPGVFWPAAEIYQNGQLLCRVTTSAPILIGVGPGEISLKSQYDTLCRQDPVRFIAYAHGAVSYQWLVEGVELSESGPVLTHTFSTFGNQKIIVRAFDSLGCGRLQEFNKILYIRKPPQLYYQAVPAGGCLPYSAQIKPTIIKGSSEIVQYNWTFTGANISSSKDSMPPELKYKKPGQFDVSLTVRTKDGCSYVLQKNKYIRVGDSAAVSFTADTLRGYEGCTLVYRTGTKAGNGKLNWSFPGGEVVDKQGDSLVKVFYPKSGYYTASLSYIHFGCTDFKREDSVVIYNEKDSVDVDSCFFQKAGFQLGGIPCHQDTVRVFNKPQYGWTYSWHSEPEGVIFFPSAEVAEPQLVVSGRGRFRIWLKVRTHAGCLDSISKLVSWERTKAKVLSADTFNICAPALVRLRADAEDAEIYEWDFGDGETIKTSSSQVTHLYKKNAGGADAAFVVRLQARSKAGCLAQKDSINIRLVGPVPEYAIDSPRQGTGILRVNFRDKSRNVKKIMFNYGDGSLFDTVAINPHVYEVKDPLAEKQVFRTKLMVWDDAGCASEFSLPEEIVVYRAAEADFTIKDSVFCGGSAIQVENKSRFAKKFAWDWNGDGIIDDTTINPAPVLAAGTYRPRLVAYNAVGVPDTAVATRTIRVLPPLTARLKRPVEFGCSGKDLTLSITGVAAGVSWQWLSEPDGQVVAGSRDTNCVFRFSRFGFHNVRLVLTSDIGCRDTVVMANAVYIRDSSDINAPQIISASIEENRTIKVTWNRSTRMGDTAYRLYRKQVGAAKEKLVFTSGGLQDTLFEDATVDVSAGPWQYRVEVLDVCGHIGHQAVVHTTIFLEAERMPAANRLSWSHYRGWPVVSSYMVMRREPGGKFRKLARVDGQQSNYLDEDVCQTEYTYRVIAESGNASAGSNSVSCKPAQSGVTGSIFVREVNVDKKGRVSLHWEADEAYKFSHYRIDRWDEEFGWTLGYGTFTSGNEWTDVDAAGMIRYYRYIISGLDECGNEMLKSDTVCSIRVRTREVSSESVLVDWNRFYRWPDGVESYAIFRSDGSAVKEKVGQVSGSTLHFIDTNAIGRPTGAVIYRVVAVSRGAQPDSSRSGWTDVGLQGQIYIPQAFTPNNDGLNDIFLPSLSLAGGYAGSNIPYRLQVFNNWGQRVFDSTDPTCGWDGRFEGKPAEEGTYLYTLFTRGADKEPIARRGTVQLVR